LIAVAVAGAAENKKEEETRKERKREEGNEISGLNGKVEYLHSVTF
jgi:hypothetical protein